MRLLERLGRPSPTGEATDTPTATPTATVGSADLERLPQVPVAAVAPPRSNGGDTSPFLRRVFENAHAMWHEEFQRAGLTYRPARPTLFSDQVHTACGTQSAAVGPFYCPASFGVYLDTRFFAALSRRVGVRLGDFAQAYVVGDALNAAAVVGDDFQRHPSGVRAPEDWTHGSSAQRQHWLTTGFTEGRPAACDTFSS